GTWTQQAACRDTPPSLWHPSDEEDFLLVAHAAAICRGCPVRSECLEHALEAPEHHGIWGGLTPRQRTMLRRRRASWAPATKTDDQAPTLGAPLSGPTIK